MGKLSKTFSFLAFGLFIIIALAGFAAWLIIGLILLVLWLGWQVVKGGAKGFKRLF